MSSFECHYSVLGIEDRKSDEAAIRKAYRKLVLKCHPDKIRGTDDEVEQAKERFLLLQEAYETLMDPQDRAWYDEHREQLLRGLDKNDLQSSSSKDPSGIVIMRYFTRSAWKAFDESPNGFFVVYSTLFTKLIDAEIDLCSDPLERSAYPEFGLTSASDGAVAAFYRFWSDFQTRRHFSHVDLYDPRNNQYNNEIRNLIKKENDAERRDAKKEYSCNIRQLVKYLKRHDPRWMALHAKKAREARLRAEEQEKQRNDAKLKAIEILKGARLMEEERWRHERRARNANRAERRVHGIYDVSSDSESTDDETDLRTDKSSTTKSNNKKKEFDQNWYCDTCKKGFKSEQMHLQHMETKKHKLAVKKLKPKAKPKSKAKSSTSQSYKAKQLELSSQNEEISDSIPPSPSSNAVIYSKEYTTILEDTNTPKGVINLNFDQFEDSSSSVEETSPLQNNKEVDFLIKSESNRYSSDDSESSYDNDTEHQLEENVSENTIFQSSLKLLNENQGKNRDTYQTADKAKRRAQRKEKRSNRISKKTMESGTNDTGNWGCKTCKKNFDTRNKLFSHIRNDCTPAYK